MKKFYLLILFFSYVLTGFAQEQFSFQLCFEDANGNKDTLILGYDSLVTDSIDVNFGEQNIVNQSWDSIFEARAINTLGPVNNLGFASKKQIVYPKHAVFIGVKSSSICNVNLTWNTSLFYSQPLRQDSYFTFPHDAADPPNYIYLKNSPQYTLCGNSYNDLGELIDQGDTIYTFALVFTDTPPMEVTHYEEIHLDVYPNPSLDGGFRISEPTSFNIYTITGEKIMSKKNAASFSLEHFAKGVYILKSEQGFVQKIVFR